MAVRIQFRRGTSTEWSSVNPVLAEGELGFESDTKVIKFGDGITAWDSLPVAAAGDITAVLTPAGSGLIGGSTSGQVTLSIDSSYVITADAIDAAGDLIVGAGPDTYARLPIGPSGSVLVADPSQSVGVRWAAASSSSGAVVPTGTVLSFAGTAPSGVELPGGFLLCDGQPVSRSTYAALFAVINDRYGAGDGSSTFNVPDLRTRVPVGFSSGDANFGSLGNKRGDVTTVLVGGTPTPGSNQVQVPSHAHGIAFTGTGVHGHSGVKTGVQDEDHGHSGSATGGNHSHNIPYFKTQSNPNSSSAIGLVGAGGDTFSPTSASPNGSHTHSVSVNNQNANHRHDIDIPSTTGTHEHAANITNTLPSSSELSRIQPSLVVNYIIKT